MSNMTSLYDTALLSEVSYILFDKFEWQRDDILKDALKDPEYEGKLTSDQAFYFIEKWEIISHQENTDTGFSATLFKRKGSDDFCYACRGTEPGVDDLIISDLGNIVVDGLAFGQIVDMYNNWQYITAEEGTAYEVLKLELLTEETEILIAEVATHGDNGYERLLRERDDLFIDMPSGKVYTIKSIQSDAFYLGDDGRKNGAGVDIGTGKVTAVGHSLGGHLATAFGRLFNSTCNDVVTINGAGFMTGVLSGLSGNSETNIRNLFKMLGGSDQFPKNEILNVFGDKWLEMTSMDSHFALGQQGDHEGIYIESASLLGTTAGHGKEQMTDSLAVYDLFIQADSKFQSNTTESTLNMLNTIFYTIENGRNNAETLECVVNGLGKLLLGTKYDPISFPLLGDNTKKRETLHKGIADIQKELSSLGPTLDINPLVNSQEGDVVARSAEEILTMAKSDNQDGLATRYALVHLNPYVVTGKSDLYENYSNGELEVYNGENKGQLSSQYLIDRCELLSLSICSQTNTDIGEIASSTKYVDVESKLDLDYGRQLYYWGTNASDSISNISNTDADHLYGMGGNDFLNGYGGDDYIEGGKGRDTLKGGMGFDTFYVQGNDEEYDIFNGGADEDTIEGSEFDDVIRVHEFEGDRTVEIINGKGGENIIAGTDQDDIIDLSGTELLNIAGIHGGSGSDHIIGNDASDDVLYGTNEDGTDDFAIDTLEGGAGHDTYHVGAGDVISDSDKNGTIWFAGEKISSVTVTQVSEGSGYYKTENGAYSLIYDQDNNKIEVFVSDQSASAFASARSLTTNMSDMTKSFEINNFSSGDFGITLEEYTPPVSNDDIVWTGTSYKNEMNLWYMADEWTLSYTSFPDGVTSNTPFAESVLLDSPPNINITGGSSGDVIFGLQGSDTLHGGDGSDIISGTLLTWDGQTIYPDSSVVKEDYLYGDGGNDFISGGGNIDHISGGTGNDFIQGYDGQDILSGDSGNDVIAGGSNNAIIFGGTGDDALYGDGYFTHESITLENLDQFKISFTYAEDGFALGVNSQNFLIHNDAPMAGDDFISGGDGRDFIAGGGGNDTIKGDADHDSISGGSGSDHIEGGTGNDMLIGDNGDQVETSDDGIDFLFGGSDAYSRNAGLYLGATFDLGISDDLSSLNTNQDNVNRELLAA